MKTLISIFLLAICCSCVTGQNGVDNGTFQVLDSLNTFRDVAVEKNIISPNHLVVVDGITMASEEHLEVCLGNISANSDTQFGLLGVQQTRTVGSKKARRGLVLVTLDRRAYKRFSKNHKQFKKKSSINSR